MKTHTLKNSLGFYLIFALFALNLSLAQTKPEAKEDEAESTEAKPVEGATIYTLPQAIKQALTISPSLDSAVADLEISKGQYQEANAAGILPKVDMNLVGGLTPDIPNGSGPESNFPNVNTSLSNLGPFMQLRLDGFQPIYSFGKISSLRRMALEGIDAKNEGIQKAKNELIWQVKKVYTGLTSLYTIKEFVLELQSRSAKAKEIIDKQIQKKSSEVTNIDVLRVEVFQAETERRLIEINNNIDFAMLALKVLMGLPRDAKIDIQDQRLRMDQTIIAPVESYIQIAKNNRPEIAQLQNLVEIREAALKGAKAGFAPTLGLAGFYRFGWAPDRQDVQNPFLVDDFNINSGGGFLVLNQNLSFHLTRSRWKQARAQYDKAIADQQRALQGIELEIRKAHTAAISKQQAVEASTKGFKSGRSWVLATTLNFGIGVTPPKDLLEAFVAYSAVKINYLQTLNDYFMAMADLSNAVGQEITDLKY